ncbi:MAG: DUF1134 domain-containing protein [Pseudomonadota bacterium]
MTDAVKTVRRLFGLNAALQRLSSIALAALCVLALSTASAGPIAAQDLETFDPDEAFVEEPAPQDGETGAIDADLIAPDAQPPAGPVPVPSMDEPAAQREGGLTEGGMSEFEEQFAIYSDQAGAEEALQWVDPSSGASVGGDAAGEEVLAADASTYGEDDLIGAAEGVFGKGAKGLAKLIEDLLKKEGKPNAYIVGREAGGAFIIGARYGSGTLYHKVEGEKKVYWTGPSIGLDAGANAANTFVLVYNLYDSEDLFKRYPAGEGQAYFIGGLHASFMRRGDVVLIPIRMGAGVRLGINAGYMKFSKKQRWLPF